MKTLTSGRSNNVDTQRTHLQYRVTLATRTTLASFFFGYYACHTRLKALDEIYKIDTFLHHSAFKNSTKSRQTFSHFHNSIFKISLIVSKKLSKTHELSYFDENLPEIQHLFNGKEQNLFDSSQIS